MTSQHPADRGVRNIEPKAPTTTDGGVPVPDDEKSAQIGRQGPQPIHDFYLIEKLAHFNRENVPERIPHAKGSGAFGEFETTEDISDITRAALFQKGVKTPMVARFSTVAGEKGSPDTWRDPRGFALKFYTTEGNYDMVGNNTPIFFIRDAIKFPDFIHSQRRKNGSGLRNNAMQWDFWTLSPESTHQVTWLMGDRGIPKTWRHMDGFSSHTYQMINAEGVRHWVKFHFKTNQGIEFLTQDEADTLAGTNGDYHREDLWNSIRDGQYPSWDLYLQVMPVDEAEGYKYNPFDLTKTWSQKDYPLRKVGTMTLNRNPQNHHAQIEQAAFAPTNIVPGIGFSPDKMLLGRVFAYPDIHRYRIGANYQQLPVNMPLSPVNSYSKEGSMAYEFNHPAVPEYHPNSIDGPTADPARAYDFGAWDTEGSEVFRGPIKKHAEDTDQVQATILYREVMDDAARERLHGNIAGHVSAIDPSETELLERVYAYWTAVDPDLGAAVKAKVEAGPRGNHRLND
ncbi:catalase [Dietzia aerolata]|uniref:Catalase n=1 Tax=Dietzia aerolata TaxID=595984 RepID=A0ABV5JV76_9ACTN